MKYTKFEYLVGDFETTVYEKQDYTEVWASAIVPLFSEDVTILHSIDETFDYLISLDKNICIYYHNLKFDGAFWLAFLFRIGFEQACEEIDENSFTIKFLPDENMKHKSFKYVISDMGQWYSITIKYKNHIIDIRDSLKLLPFSVKKIGESFKTKHKKLDMEYEGFRYAGCEITDEEKEYIKNDVLVVKEALEIMFNEGHKQITIGACCLSEYKNIIGKELYNTIFPDVSQIPLDYDTYGSHDVDEYIRKSYKGGWCYLVKGKENKIYHNGITADVNSLYPSMMSSESGNKFPYGKPHFWKGNYIPDEALYPHHYFFIRIRTCFYLKKDMLPCIQIKTNFRYNSREWLETSDVYIPSQKRYVKFLKTIDGEIKPARVTLTLTMTDYELIRDHYDLVDFEILDGCWFKSSVGLFDDYINKYKKIKLESKGALRELAKLFLNNLYGKLASSSNSSFKFAYLKDDGSVGFIQITENNKKTGYIPVGSAITSYARNFTIRHAQMNYYGKDKRGFIYADTDSIHCDLAPDELDEIKVDSKNFCCWKLESSWDEAFFTRQKTYIEHVVAENLTPIEKPYYSVKCAGMPERCKELFMYSLQGISKKDYEECTDEEKEFVSKRRTLEDFTIGLKVPSKLLPKRIKGGIILEPTTYEMR